MHAARKKEILPGLPGRGVNGSGTPRRLIAYTNPWSFAIAVDRALAAEQRDAAVDVVNLNALSGHSAFLRPIDRLAETLNRKYERFITPIVTGCDITEQVRPSIECLHLPPLPEEPAALRSYSFGGARVGLAVLSSVTSLTTVQDARDLSEFGPALLKAWRIAHLSALVGRAVAKMGYEAAYIFNGRHCISRPFCEVLQMHMPVFRYEQGGSGNRYIISGEGVHEPSSVAELIKQHPVDVSEGKKFFTLRLRKAEGSGVEFFTASQIEGLVPDNAEIGRTVTLFTSSSDEMYAISDTLSYGDFDSQYEAALAIADACARHGFGFVIRFHPHLQYKDRSWMREWDFERLKELGSVVVMPNEPIDTYALIRLSRCVFSCGSTVGFEASYLGVPAADIGNWVGGLIGAVATVTSNEDIEEFVRNPRTPRAARAQAIRFGSYARRGGKLLPELEIGTHPYFARIGGRVVDPVRYVYQKLRSPLSPASRAILPAGGKVLVEPSVVREVAKRLRVRANGRPST